MSYEASDKEWNKTSAALFGDYYLREIIPTFEVSMTRSTLNMTVHAELSYKSPMIGTRKYFKLIEAVAKSMLFPTSRACFGKLSGDIKNRKYLFLLVQRQCTMMHMRLVQMKNRLDMNIQVCTDYGHVPKIDM
jgi:hypothetical protein